jgi:hypothetical protein
MANDKFGIDDHIDLGTDTVGTGIEGLFDLFQRWALEHWWPAEVVTTSQLLVSA